MGYLSDYLYYTSGNECPQVFWQWSAFSLFAHILGKRVWYNHGAFVVHPPLYIGLIGDAGSGKSSAKSEAKTLLVKHFPSLLYSASIQSREDIVGLMAADECARHWKDETGAMHEYRPFYIIANEFENFLSVDTRKMVAFLVDVFDEKWFSTGFKKDRAEGKQQTFDDPSVSILACGTPEWLMTELKMSLFTGGLGRRLILVCGEAEKPVDFPARPGNWEAYERRVVQHLKEASALIGEMKLSDEGRKWWTAWYTPHWHDEPEDPILAQFHSTKHIMLLKLAILVALDERPFRKTITPDDLTIALSIINDLSPRIQRLTGGIGRNELAGYSVQMLTLIEKLGGRMSEKRLRMMMERNLGTREYEEIKTNLQKTDRLVELDAVQNGVTTRIVMTAEAYRAYTKASSPTPPGASPSPGS